MNFSQADFENESKHNGNEDMKIVRQNLLAERCEQIIYKIFICTMHKLAKTQV